MVEKRCPGFIISFVEIRHDENFLSTGVRQFLVVPTRTLLLSMAALLGAKTDQPERFAAYNREDEGEFLPLMLQIA